MTDGLAPRVPSRVLAESGAGLWHVTLIRNLPSILRTGALLSNAALRDAGEEPDTPLDWSAVSAGSPNLRFVCFLPYLRGMRHIVHRFELGRACLLAFDLLVADLPGVRFSTRWPTDGNAGADGICGIPGGAGARAMVLAHQR